MKLQLKILTGYVSIITFFITVGILLFINIDSANPVLVNMDEGIIKLEKSLKLKELTSEILYLRITLEGLTLDYILTHDDNFKQSYDRAEIKLHLVFEEAIKKSDPEDRIIFENLFETINKIETTEKEIFDLIKEGKDAQALILLNDKEYHELTESINDFIFIFSNRKQSQSEDVFSSLVDITNDIKENKNNLNNLANFTIYSIVLVVTLGIITGFFISRSISKPIIKLKLATDLVSQGQFDFQIDSTMKKSNDEIGELVKSFDVMIKSIQEKIELERRLSASEEKVKNERLTAIGELSASIAHDIRNPLFVIKNSNTLMEKIVHDEKGLNEIRRIDRSVARITHQLNQVLDFIRTSPLKLEQLSLTGILDGVIKILEIPPNISINMPQDDFEILIDHSKMESVFYNILYNAIQAIGNQKGTITIKISDEVDMIKIDFENDGPNIPDEVLPKIFEPLFTTKQIGTGLGLSAVKNSVVQHGGTISVTNNPVVFTIKLPKTKNS